jgi:hypothetical protein
LSRAVELGVRGLPFGGDLAERRGRLAFFYAGGGIGTAGYRRAFLLRPDAGFCQLDARIEPECEEALFIVALAAVCV